MNDDNEFFSRAEKEHAAGIDTSVPHSARIWNYWLGGKDNFPVDRAAGDHYVQTFPGIVDVARLTRHFLKRSIRYLVVEAGIRQFLDVGTGLPTVDNTHEVAQGLVPEARVVYVDNDPLVLVHAHVLLTSTPEGATDYVEADMHDPAAILAGAARTLDLAQPVGLTFMGVLGHVQDDDAAVAIVARLMDGLAPGSHLVVCDGTEVVSVENAEAQRDYDEGGSVPYKIRTLDQVRRFFTGLDLLEPGVVPCLDWRPEVGLVGAPPPAQPLAGIAAKW
ncbi:SAM-dependent methyltransferase [Actinomadura rubrisoli]|uniref:SAM-dependent methyltransferase n=1 Tax=Actinomadura rubrisoli TaxID=2530368 RepID=A0A4R5AKE3_9ACTN|nr:SAM-dependent methyltransferase [Actinomadura rubrisoli]TDD71464.1 SAM-dependent methyltransferase [Actinomadura rubrisoli]